MKPPKCPKCGSEMVWEGYQVTEYDSFLPRVDPAQMDTGSFVCPKCSKS